MLLSSMAFVAALAACSPEIGTKAWCDDLAEKTKSDWTASEATDFAKYCLLRNYKSK